MRVLHAMQEYWLERTQAWLWVAITSLPPEIENHVSCHVLQHADEFPFPRVHCRDQAGPLRRAWHRLADRAGQRQRFGWGRHVARTLRPAVIHSHFGPTGWEMLRAAADTRARHVVTFYGLDVNALPKQGWAPRYHEMFPAVDLVQCEGPHMRDCVIALGAAPERVRVHRLGVDLSRLPYEPRRWRPGEPLRVLLASSFREKKGLPYAIAALGRIRTEVDLQVVVIGGPSDSPEGRAENARIQAAIGESGLGDRLVLRGFQPYTELVREAARSHVFLAPSVTAASGDTEGGAPVTLIEMAASGMPIVSTRHCDIPDIVEDGVTGLLADERDVDGLVQRLRQMVAAHATWPQMLAAGRARVERNHDSRRQAAALAAAYRELTAT